MYIKNPNENFFIVSYNNNILKTKVKIVAHKYSRQPDETKKSLNSS